MIAVKKILVPVDFSDGARAALDLAAGLATAFSAAIELYHVWQPPPLVPVPLVVVSPEQGRPLTLEQLARTEAGTQMKDLVEHLRGRGVATVTSRVGVGDPAHEILDLARVGGFDLIVMGTHGRHGIAHALLGSVAEKVVRRATCPVLTVRSPG